MSEKIATILKQIEFCETYLLRRTDPEDPTNTREIRIYVEEQLALARATLASTEDTINYLSNRTRTH